MDFHKSPRLHQFDAGYLQALCRGDSATETHFVTYFTPFLQSKLRRELSHQEDLGDAVNESFMRVLSAVRSSGVVRCPERFGAFVIAVAGNVAREFKRGQFRYTSIHDLCAEPQDNGAGPHLHLAAREAGERVRRVLGRLSRKDRTVLSALYLHEQEKKDVCRRLGISQGHLRVLLCRARKEFRRKDLIAQC
jgi:RNA polymerase sigma factor (sigma-70 family)